MPKSGSQIEIPEQLQELLEGSEYDAPIRELADKLGKILADNKLTFFPDYTDHGIDHINSVLESEVDLVPQEVWALCEQGSKPPRPLSDADAAVIVGATLLHDIAMHLQPSGFLELVSKTTRFRPLPWFRDSSASYPSADRPWDELWEKYEGEARRFSDHKLGQIIGPESAQAWKFEGLPADQGRWERNHFLLIGEFIRRHHARLAHEIAIYGFPGLQPEHNIFLAMWNPTNPLRDLADLIGLTARSHGISLRVCQAYLDDNSNYRNTPQPMGTAVLYPMALLRVADYLQIDRQRAPAVLLQLRAPQSPLSVQEWAKHLAVLKIVPAKDPLGKTITISQNVDQETFLQLEELLAGIQAEMDHSTAVLNEVYGRFGDLKVDKLNLAVRRVRSNLQEPQFRKELPYIPERTGFSADPNILNLLVEPLYGQHPGVAIRELLQNAVDAVRELYSWCENHGKSPADLDLPKQEADVQIDYLEQADGSWRIVVQDKGIGMTADTLQGFFLRAGASFRSSSAWAEEFVNSEGQPRVLRGGRFGVGAFAIFLLGPTFRLWTRHVGASKLNGYSLTAVASQESVKIRREPDLPVGTRIEIDLAQGKLPMDKPSQLTKLVDWFTWSWPTVTQRLISQQGSILPLPATHCYELANLASRRPPEWAEIQPSGFDAVYWTFINTAPELTCNGIAIKQPESSAGATPDWTSRSRKSPIDWPDQTGFAKPKIAVADSLANLPLTVQRYELAQASLSFTACLVKDIALSCVAHALICGPTDHSEAILQDNSHPLSRKSVPLWLPTGNHMVPADPWLFSLLKCRQCILWGFLGARNTDRFAKNIRLEIITYAAQSNYLTIELDRHSYHQTIRNTRDLVTPVRHGIEAIGLHIASSAGLISTSDRTYSQGTTIANVGAKLADKPHNPNRKYSKIQKGSLIPTGKFLDSLMLIGDNPEDGVALPDFWFVAELISEPRLEEPRSALAKAWHESLGPNPIPFDHQGRQELIRHGCLHPELKRHIEAWQELKKQRESS